MASHDVEKFVDGNGDEFKFRDNSAVHDVKIDGTSVVSSGAASIPMASSSTKGVVKVDDAMSSSSTNPVQNKVVNTAIESAKTDSKLYANQKWGGAFRATLSPLDTYFILNKNYFLGVAANCVSVEYSTDGGSTWIDYGLTDLQKRNLFNQFATVDVYCGKNTHIQPGYNGSITGTKDLTDEIIADQRLRITISSRPFGNAGTTSRTGEWMICSNMRRFAIYMSTQSAASKTHCKVQSRTIANFCSGTNTWVDHGDYPIVGDSGWNSIPIGNDSAEGGFGFGSYDSVSTTNRSEFRFEIWSEKLNASPASSQTGNLCIKTICSIADKLSKTTSKFRSILYNGLCCTSVDMENGWPVFENGIKFTARKLKTKLDRTADSTFDGSADQLNIPVTGTLPVGNGGTGKSSVTSGNYLVGNGTSALVEKTPKDVGSDVLSHLDADNGNVVDYDYIVGSYHVNDTTISSTLFVRRTAVKLWNYIKSKLAGSDVNIGGNAATATKATQDADGSAINTTYKKLAGSSKFTEPQWIDDNTRTSYQDIRIGNKYKLMSVGISGAGNLLIKELADGRDNSPSSDNPIIYTSQGGASYNFNGNAATATALVDDSGYVHTSGNESIGGTKKFTAKEVFSESTEGSWNGFIAKRTNTSTNKTYKVSLEAGDNGERGIYDYDDGDHGGENKWLIKKDANNNISIGESSNINKVSIGGVTLDFSGTLGSNTNTLYFA